MDLGQQGQGPEDEADGAEQAFEALREEVAVLRRGIELVYRKGQQASPVPDYSLTLGAIAKELTTLTRRLDVMARAPALAVTPGQLAAELRDQLQLIGQDARSGMAVSQVQLDRTVGELRGMMASARTSRDQRRRLRIAGAGGGAGGMVLWLLLTALLPWGAGTWLAGVAFGGRWNAGQVIMQDANPAAWERMVRLYKACSQDSATELCEAALAVRFGTTPGTSHGR